MFVALVNNIETGQPSDNANRILSLDAASVSLLMESAWSMGGPGRLSKANEQSIAHLAPAPVWISLNSFNLPDEWSPVWDHLIYAYMIGNTRIYEIFRRVLHEFLHGEKLVPLQKGFEEKESASNAGFQGSLPIKTFLSRH